MSPLHVGHNCNPLDDCDVCGAKVEPPYRHREERNPMTEWNVETALNHHAGCSVYDDGACTCGLRARTKKLERSPLAPGDGTWSVFAQKVVAERDAAREEVARLRVENERLRAKNAKGETK